MGTCVFLDLQVKVTGGLWGDAHTHGKLCVQDATAACTPIFNFAPVVLLGASHDKHADNICANTELSSFSSVTAADIRLADQVQPVVLRYVPSDYYNRVYTYGSVQDSTQSLHAQLTQSIPQAD